MLMRDPIRTAGNLAAVFGRRRPSQGVGPGIINAFHLARDNRPVPFHSGFDLHHRRMAMGGQENLFSGQHPLHRPVRLARQGRRQRLQARMHFAAIAATDVRHDDAHFRLRQIEKLGNWARIDDGFCVDV